jgi:hypothetical protein
MPTSPKTRRLHSHRSGRKVGKADNALDPQLWAQLAKGISYVQGDFLDDSTYTASAKDRRQWHRQCGVLPGHRAAFLQ